MGSSVGRAVGATEGETEGAMDSWSVGASVGGSGTIVVVTTVENVGLGEGWIVGETVGDGDGASDDEDGSDEGWIVGGDQFHCPLINVVANAKPWSPMPSQRSSPAGTAAVKWRPPSNRDREQAAAIAATSG